MTEGELTIWEIIGRDPDLAALLRKASMRELYTLARHVRKPYQEALAALIANPHGCRFCDYGVLRTPNDPAKSHDDDCPYMHVGWTC